MRKKLVYQRKPWLKTKHQYKIEELKKIKKKKKDLELQKKRKKDRKTVHK